MNSAKGQLRIEFVVAVLVSALGGGGYAVAVPVNDLCADSIPIGDGATAFDTTDALTDGPAEAGCEFDGQTYHDIWYTYTASCTGNLTVSTCNNAAYDTDLVVYDGCDCGNLTRLGCNDDGAGCGGFTSEVTVSVVATNCYLIRVGGWSNGSQGAGTVTLTCAIPGDGACCQTDDTCTFGSPADCATSGGEFKGDGVQCDPDPCAASAGPDVIYSDCNSISSYGGVSGIQGYALGTDTCNIGDQNLLWGDSWDGTPAMAMNAYRLSQGRLMQIGMAWVKHACCAAAGSGCGLACNGQGGSVLGVGCKDVYSSGWNGIQGRLGPRSAINAFTGEIPAAPSGSGDAIFRRLQIRESDMMDPTALYFVEGVYVASDDAPSGNALNNASYKRAIVGGGFALNPTGSMYTTVPAIYAWRDHGNGVDTPDTSVEIVPADIPGEGRLFIGGKVTDLGGGTWRYDYALYNLNSHRSAASLSIPLPDGAAATTVDFNGVDYHSGEPYDNTDWTSAVDAASVTWQSPQTFAENPDSNALRWATMYTFGFEADAPPYTVDASIGLFRPGKPASITAPIAGPSTDCNGNNIADGQEIADDPGLDTNGNGVLDACEAFIPQMVAGGSRYLAADVSGGADSFALWLTGDQGNPTVSCVASYVQPDGSLGPDAVFQTASAWGSPIDITAPEILPGVSYRLQADTGSLGSPILGPAVTADTRAWGDADGDGEALFNDILLVIRAFQGDFSGATMQATDYVPCGPDGEVLFEDILADVQAFQGSGYESTGCPLPCP